MKIIKEIFNTISRHEMLRKGDRVLVAVSGGPDSVFLLHILKELEGKLGIKLFVCHLDHSMRGRESSQDAKFVKRLAKKLNLRAVTAKIKEKQSSKKLSKEEWLRGKRYLFFKRSAHMVRANAIATAHTMDDQAETVIMRVIKGSSIKGLVGVHPVRLENKIKFIRPLISFEKKEILMFLEKSKIPYRLDQTNKENAFLRNRIRNKLLPHLAQYNPRIKRSLCNLAESLKEDFDFIAEEKKKRASLLKGEGPARSICLSSLLLQPKAIQKEMVRETLLLMGANVKKLTYRHRKDIEDFVTKKAKGKSLDLPDGVRVVKGENVINFIKLLR